MKSIIEILERSDDPYTDVAKEMYGPHISTEQRTIARLLVEALCRFGPYIRPLTDVLVRNGLEPYGPIAKLIAALEIDYSREHMDDIHRKRRFNAFLRAELACFEIDKPVEDLSHHDLTHLVTGYRDLIKELKRYDH